MDDGDELGIVLSHNTSAGSKSGGDKMFSLKKWNAVAMWSWDVECDTCAICRVQVMDACLRCQAENKQEDCVGLGGSENRQIRPAPRRRDSQTSPFMHPRDTNLAVIVATPRAEPLSTTLLDHLIACSSIPSVRGRQ
ncbi:RING-box protein 2 isoform X2 [Phycodurus eques]|uniref:RING-box protein 2 isoform X2 n=1 Tax=Phycodurus eques TaxID=693459 RepID=UPI002ACE34C9|nr:RING-box protein 2 isoform X2 [Phycodurus eques]